MPRLFSANFFTGRLPALRLPALGLVISLIATPAIASVIKVENAGTYVDNGVYYVDAFTRLELGAEPERALMSGVHLHFLIELKIQKTRRFWIDTPILERRLRYRLFFYELTGHYRIDDLQSGETANYRSLSAALRYLGSVERYALIEATRLKDSRRYTATISMSLDNTRLPGPLATQAMVSREWNLQSEVFEWSLN